MSTTTLSLVRAREIMTRSPVTVPHTATVAEAAALLEEEGIHGAPVLSSYGKVIGVVSRTDVARHLREALDDAAEGPASSVLEALISRRLAEGNEVVEGLSAPVQAAMSERPVTAGLDASAGELAELMHREGIRIVGEKTRIVGIKLRRPFKDGHCISVPLHCHVGSREQPPADRVVGILLQLLSQLFDQLVQTLRHLPIATGAALRGSGRRWMGHSSRISQRPIEDTARRGNNHR